MTDPDVSVRPAVTPDSPFEQRADYVLQLAKEVAEHAQTYHPIWNAIFGRGAPGFTLFPDRAEQERFRKGPQYGSIVELMDEVRNQQPQLQVPRSTAVTLAQEAERAGVSLKALFAARLATPLTDEVVRDAKAIAAADRGPAASADATPDQTDAGRTIADRADELLRRARAAAAGTNDWTAVSNAVFAPQVYNPRFPTRPDREAFIATPQHAEVKRLIAEVRDRARGDGSRSS